MEQAMLVDQMAYLHASDYALSAILQEFENLSKLKAYAVADMQFGQVATDTLFDQVAVDIRSSLDIIDRQSGFDNKFDFANLNSLIVRSNYPTSNQLRGH